MITVLRRLNIAGMALLVIAATLLATMAPAHAATKITNGNIYYAGGGANDNILYAVDADGSNPRTVLTAPRTITSAAASPDGKKLVLSINDGVNDRNLYTVNIDGTGLTKITSDFDNIQAFFSPDSAKLVFQKRVTSGSNAAIYTSNADGTNATLISSDDQAIPMQWTKSGKIIFSKDDGQGGASNGLYSMSTTGGNVQLIHSNNGLTIFGQYNNDETKLTYSEVDQNAFTSTIYIANADGSNPQVVDSGAGFNFAMFTPDGTQLAETVLTPNPSSTITIKTINFDGTNAQSRALGTTTLQFFAVAWAPVITTVPDASNSPAATAANSNSTPKAPDTGFGGNTPSATALLIVTLISTTAIAATGFASHKLIAQRSK